MTTRQKLELPINQPVTVELLFDEAITGTSRYGNYTMYAVEVEDEEYSFFPVPEVHDKLKDLHKGDRAVITKLAVQRGAKLVTAYEVRPVNTTAPQPSKEATVPIDELQENIEEGKLEDEFKTEKPIDNYYFVMLACYNDAIRLQKELNGMIDIEKAAITLYISRTKH